MDIRELSALELGSAIKKKEISCREAAEVYLKAIGEKDGTVGAYITVLDGSGEENTAEERTSDSRVRTALAQADEVQAKIDAGELDHAPLAGVPAAVKDNMCR